jgi:hypothetical protein
MSPTGATEELREGWREARRSEYVPLEIRAEGRRPLGSGRQPRRERSPICESWVGAVVSNAMRAGQGTGLALALRFGAEWAFAHEMPASAWTPIASTLSVCTCLEFQRVEVGLK